MLRLEHINLVVKDIASSLKFYQAALPHWWVREQGEGTWQGKPRRWLHFGDDYQYITLNDNGEGDSRSLSGHEPGLAHFAFSTLNLSAVIARLTEAGFEIAKSGADDPHRRNVYFVDPDGIEVEFVQYSSDLPGERNLSR